MKKIMLIIIGLSLCYALYASGWAVNTTASGTTDSTTFVTILEKVYPAYSGGMYAIVENAGTSSNALAYKVLIYADPTVYVTYIDSTQITDGNAASIALNGKYYKVVIQTCSATADSVATYQAGLIVKD